MGTWMLGLDEFSTHWKYLPWFAKHIETLPAACVFITKVASTVDDEANSACVFIQVHEENGPNYAQLVELNELSSRVLKTYAPSTDGWDIAAVGMVSLKHHVEIDILYTHRTGHTSRSEREEIAK